MPLTRQAPRVRFLLRDGQPAGRNGVSPDRDAAGTQYRVWIGFTAEPKEEADRMASGSAVLGFQTHRPPCSADVLR